MLTPVERVLILRGADLLREIGPRHLVGLADAAREVGIAAGETLYGEDDAADALYIVVEGRVRLSRGDQEMAVVGAGEAFGTWSLVDDSARGHRAECLEAGTTLAVHRDDFYDVAAGDLGLLTELVRVLAKRLRALVIERPEEARIEGEGTLKPEAPAAIVSAPLLPATPEVSADVLQPPAAGIALAAAALGHAGADTTAAPQERPVETESPA